MTAITNKCDCFKKSLLSYVKKLSFIFLRMLQGLSLACVILFFCDFWKRGDLPPLLNKKANSCLDSLERPGSHSKRRAGCSPHLGSEAFSLSGKSCAFPGHLLAPSSGSLAAAASLPWLSSAPVRPGWDTPEQSKGAPQTCSQMVCVAGDCSPECLGSSS